MWESLLKLFATLGQAGQGGAAAGAAGAPSASVAEKPNLLTSMLNSSGGGDGGPAWIPMPAPPSALPPLNNLVATATGDEDARRRFSRRQMFLLPYGKSVTNLGFGGR